MQYTLHLCMVIYAALTPRIKNILHHVDHAICCHQVAVWHIHRVDMNRVVYLGKTEKTLNITTLYISTYKAINKTLICELQ